MFGRKERKIRELRRTIRVLKEVINSLEEDLAEARLESYKAVTEKIKKPRKPRLKKEV